jgi:hypothetical protein
VIPTDHRSPGGISWAACESSWVQRSNADTQCFALNTYKRHKSRICNNAMNRTTILHVFRHFPTGISPVFHGEKFATVVITVIDAS